MYFCNQTVEINRLFDKGGVTWLDVGYLKKNIDFILKDVIDTCQEIIKNLYSFFNLEIKFINECNSQK